MYEGEIYVRPVMRGIVLEQTDGRLDLEDWLVAELGLDNWAGERRWMRLTAEPLAAPGDDDNGGQP